MSTSNDPFEPASLSDNEAAAQETDSAVVTAEEKSAIVTAEGKVADRPHRFTLYASFGALGLSVISLLVSMGSLYFTRLSLHVGQRAYLSSTPTFPDYKDDPNASENDSLLLPAEIEIKNLGNTPAYNVLPTVSPKTPDSAYQFSSTQTPIPAIGPKESARFQINVLGSRRNYRNGLKFPGAAPSMCISTAYTDVFGEWQNDKACFSPSFKISIVGYNPPRPVPSQ